MTTTRRPLTPAMRAVLTALVHGDRLDLLGGEGYWRCVLRDGGPVHMATASALMNRLLIAPTRGTRLEIQRRGRAALLDTPSPAARE